MEYKFNIPVQSHHRAYQLENCAVELSAVLMDVDNWEDPLVPGGADNCPPLEFAPRLFNEKSILWMCEQPTKEQCKLF